MRAEREWAAYALRLLDRAGIRSVVLACSGGGDSLALLWLCARDWRLRQRVRAVVVVDHGLRLAAVRESARVVGTAARAGFAGRVCRVVVNRGPGLQSRARSARFVALESVACASEASGVLLGHTRDDLAETLLDRFLAGRGARALDAMRPVAGQASGPARVRPLLKATRAEVRDYLASLGEGYVDDPSNEDDSFQRVRLRKWLSQLDSATRTRFLEVAPRLQEEGAAIKALVAESGRRLSLSDGRAPRLEEKGEGRASVLARVSWDSRPLPLLAVVGWVESVVEHPLAMTQVDEMARVLECGRGEVRLASGFLVRLQGGEWLLMRAPRSMRVSLET